MSEQRLAANAAGYENDDSKLLGAGIQERSNSLVKINPRVIKPISFDDRKNSSSDLHSRLKTRKVLGVGEIRDDGDIYRSKISQILGHSEHLYVKLPKGLFYWQVANVTYLFGSGLLCLLLPKMTVSMEILLCPVVNEATGHVVQLQHLPVRFYGAALIGFCILYRGLMITRERSYIANGLLGTSVLFGLQVLVTLPSVWSCRYTLSNAQLFIFATKALFGIVGNCIYYGFTSSASSSSSFSSMPSRLLRWFGLNCAGGGYGDGGGNICGARTPLNSSNYNIAAVASSASANNNAAAAAAAAADSAGSTDSQESGAEGSTARQRHGRGEGDSDAGQSRDNRTL